MNNNYSSDRKRAVVILGSGASIEFLLSFSDDPLTTEKLTYIISKNLTQFESYIKDYFNNNEIFWIKNYLFEIITSLRKFFGNSFNFEHVIHLIDILADIYKSKYINLFGKMNLKMYNIYLPLIDFFGGQIGPYLGKILSDFPIVVRYFILDYICGQHPPLFRYSANNIDFNLWKNFILNITTKHNLSIFSLNYDSLLYEVIFWINKNYIDKNEGCYIQIGAKIEELPENKVVSLDLTKIKVATNVFIPLHGSVHFVPSSNSVLLCRDCSKAKEERKRVWMSIKEKPEGTSDYNQIMITGLSKFDSMSKEPFSTFYIRAVKDIIEADRIFIIGYGGGDEHLNMLIKSSNAREIHFVTKIEDEYFGSYLRLLDDEIIWTWRKFLPDDFLENLDLKITEKTSIRDKYFIYPIGAKSFLKRVYCLDI